MAFLLRQLALWTTSRPKLILSFGFILALLSLTHAALFLKFDTNQDNLISKDQTYLQNYTRFLKEFGDWEYIYVVIKNQNGSDFVKKAKSFSKELSLNLKKHETLFEQITYKINTKAFENNFLLLAPKNNFTQFVNFTQSDGPLLTQFLNISSLNDWYLVLNQVFSKTDSKNQKSLEKYWPLLKNSLNAPFEKKALEQLNQTNLISLFSDQFIDPEGYLFSENGQLLFIRIAPKKNFESMEIIQEPLRVLRKEIQSLKKRYPELLVGITGRPVLQNDEATSTQSDSEWAGLISFLLVAGLFFIFFRSYKRSLFSLFSLALGILWTTGFVSLIWGSINLITIVFAIILIGLGIDYGVHFLLRYQHQRKEQSTTQALLSTSKQTGRAILLGALTSAIAFGTALFTDFLGLQQLGLIAGIGILLCALAQLSIFPALLQVFDQGPALNLPTPDWSKLAKVTKAPKKFSFIILLGSLTLLPLSLQTQFSNNLLELQDPNLESVRFERIIQEHSGISTWFLAYATSDLNQLSWLSKRIASLPSVKKVSSILDLVPLKQEKRLAQIKKIKIQILSQKTQTTKTLSELIESLKNKIDKLASQSFSSGLAEEYEELDQVSQLLNSQLNLIKKSDPPLKKEFLESLKNKQNLLNSFLNPTELTESDIPPQLLSNFKSANGQYSLTIYPKSNIWDAKAMESFLSEVRQVLPLVTGAPVTHFESSQRMIQGFILVAFLTSLIVLVLMILEFRSLKVALLIYGALVLTFIWLTAFMEWVGLSINLANFFALPVLIGSGIDHGIHLFHRYRETNSIEELYRSTIPAVALSCLTTIFGFASLSFVRHQGLASFGMIMAVGTFLILLMSVFVLPNMIKYFDLSQQK